MAEKEKSLRDILGGEIHHIAISVKDLDEALKFWNDMGFEFGDISYGVRKPDAEPPDRKAWRRGKPISYKLREAYSTNSKPIIELEEVLEGTPVQKEFIEAKGNGVQHVCWRVDDLEETIAKCKELGIEVAQRIGVRHGVMMDTSKMCGFYLELVERRT